ncbi:MAG: hypothetical protein M3R10_00460 [Verrucomicrobiota bacterium]|nr:hypothetical protein [Verrucomicrobiota bacterium]
MKTAAQTAVCLGTIVSATIALLPYLRDFFITAYVAGALAAVWFVVRKQQQAISVNEGARLGFLSGFYGLLVASATYDLVWQTFHYRLWKIENADRVFALLTESMRDAFSPSAWMLITLQIVIVAVCAGAFGVPSGILAVKILQRS